MKFLMTYRQAPSAPPPTPDQMAALGKFTEDNVQSGVVVMTGGMIRPTKGTKVALAGGSFTVTDGPFAETKELIDGFAIVNVTSKEHALEVAQSFMRVAGDGEGEILQIFEGGEGHH